MRKRVKRNRLRRYTAIAVALIFFTIITAVFFYYNIPKQEEPYKEDTPNNNLITFADPKVVRSNSILDADGDKIADTLSTLINGEIKSSADLKNAFRESSEKVEVVICVDKKPDDALIEKLRGYDAEISAVYDNLIYAIAAKLPIDEVSVVAADTEVTLIEKKAYSTGHLDTSTINIGARGSSYVWDATPAIKGNPNYAIAILDTGVDSTHPDMENFIYFRDFTMVYSNGSTGYDYGHHGTHCASIAAGTGAADIDQEIINETISYTFTESVGSYYITHWFEVKDNADDPDTVVELNWDTSGSGSAYFGIMNSSGDWITSYGPYSTSPLIHNLGNIDAGWYQVVCAPEVDATCEKEYIITIEHEYNYTLDGESASTPIFTGVAPQSNIVSLKILDDSGSGTDTWFLQALDWISENGKNPTYNITTVSMSIGFNGIYGYIDAAVNNLVGEGFICVTSAGNDGTNSGANAIHSPGTARKCITVGAVNDAFEITYYSSNGADTLTYSKPDVVAPGGTVAVSDSNSPHNLIVAADSNYGEDYTSMADQVADDYRGMQGTSMACPHVSGLAQLAIDAIIRTEGSWTWSQANALKVKQLICMGTWEVTAGETIDWDDDGIPQNPTLDRTGSDYVEGYGMVRADAVVQAITNTTTKPFTNTEFYLDRRPDSHAKDPKVLVFSLDIIAGKIYNFSLDVPTTGDFDLLIYDKDYDSNTGRPVVITSSINSGLDVNESVEFIPAESGTYYWSVRAVEGYGTCKVTLADKTAPEWSDLTENTDPLEFGDLETISINVTDDVEVLKVWISLDSENYTMNNVEGNNYSYSWTPGSTGLVDYTIYMNDTVGNLNSTTGSITVQDTTLPTWDQEPKNQTIEFGDEFSYDLNATDLSGINSWWINDTVNFSISSVGVITNATPLYVYIYLLEIRACDPYDNNATAIINVTVEDTIFPTWDFTPNNQTVEFGVEFYYDLNASDLSGINQWWINETTNFSINGVGEITNKTILSVGIYWLEIRACDPYNNNCTATINVTVEDTTLPTWDQEPTNQTAEFGDDFYYNLNASDLSGIKQWWINDTTNFSINDVGEITNASILSVKIYWLEIRGCDPYNNNCTAIINITIIDTTPPTWDQMPSDQFIEFNYGFTYDLNASDLSGIDDWWINDTVRFSINEEGEINNTIPLSVGVYWLEIRACDPYNNNASATINITVADTTSPTWDHLPTNLTIEFGAEFSYNLNASDLSGIDHWWISDTANFSIDGTGVVSNATTLSVGEYWLEIRACDPYNNYCTIIIKIIVQNLPTDGDDDDDNGPQEFTFPMENLLILIGIIGGVAAIGIVVVIMRRGRSVTIV
jgi:subtilisin family serine protease